MLRSPSIAMLMLLGSAVFVALLWVEHATAVTLPAPSGPWGVGRELYAWAGTAGGIQHELMVWIWYPVEPAPRDAPKEEYMPARWLEEVERTRGVVLGKLLTRDLSRVHTHSVRNAVISPRERTYPVVVFRGGASAEVANYTTLAEDLASHGYIVVGFDAPYRTGVVAFPDGRVMKRTPENNPELCVGRPDQERCAMRLLSAWTSDIAWVLDRLERMNSADDSGKFRGRLDLSRVGLFGHSFGGAAIALFCERDARCKAGVDVDGAPVGSVIQAGIAHPFLFLLSDHSHEPAGETSLVRANIQSIYDRLPADGRVSVAIRGAYHFGFSDDGALLKSQIVLRVLRGLGVLGMDGRRQLAVTSYCLRTFFDAYVKGPNTGRVKMASALYPEVQVLE